MSKLSRSPLVTQEVLICLPKPYLRSPPLEGTHAELPSEVTETNGPTGSQAHQAPNGVPLSPSWTIHLDVSPGLEPVWDNPGDKPAGGPGRNVQATPG